MAMPASSIVPSSPNPSAQGSPHCKGWSNLRTGEPGSAFRGIGRGRGGRGGGVKGGRVRGHPPIHSGQKEGSHSDTTSSIPSPSPKTPSVSHIPPVQTSNTPTTNGVPEEAVNGSAERGPRPKPGSHKPPRAVPTVVVAPASPTETSQIAPSTPSRSANRRRRSQSSKTSTVATKKPPLPNASKAQKSRGGSSPASQTVMRKDVPPHLVAAHKAEICHDIDALVERVRAVAMAENRPTTPGSHIDWAGDEDGSLPDLDDWGVTTAHTDSIRDEHQNEEISPILADTLRPLPEPNSNSEVHQEEREMEAYFAQPEQIKYLPTQPLYVPNPTGAAFAQSTFAKITEQCTVVPTAVEESSSPTLSDVKFSLHPSLPPKPVAAMENLCARGRSISKPSNLPSKPPVSVVEEEALTTTTEGLSESMHAPLADERFTLEGVSDATSGERGLATSIHAPVLGFPESHSAPNLLSGHPSSRTHSRSQTEGRPGIHQSHTAPPGVTTNRHGRSGASSPLGKQVFTHSRNHSTPAGGTGSRPPQASRPVITGEAISRLARTIGRLEPTPRTQAFSATKDSTISS